MKDSKKNLHKDPEIHPINALITYFGYALPILIGHLRDFFASLTGISRYKETKPRKGFAVLFKSWECFFTRRIYHRIQDCWGRPIASPPGAHIEVLERESKDYNCTLQLTGNKIKCLNLGSYNYLGFADDWKTTCKPEVLGALQKWPMSMCSSRMDLGTVSVHVELENTVARFVGKEAAMVFSMGYGTNSTVIPTLMGDGTLIVSDSLNHTSIINGARACTAMIRVFKHNTPSHLEEVLREAIVNGQPRHHRPWKKILVMVEGIYSMEGAICHLPEVVALCKKYKAYLYVDEAHSIGALGKTGRGVCEYTGVNPDDVDILMGTFTKSFSGMGGYIAGSRDLIEHLKSQAAGLLYHNSMSPVVCQQVISAFKVIMGEDGTNIGRQKLDALLENSNYFRAEMHRLGLHVYGQVDSPIIPIMLYCPGKIAAFSRECLNRGLAVVVVGFPATSVVMSRARVCVSAGHTKQDLDFAVKIIEEVSELLCLRYSKSVLGF